MENVFTQPISVLMTVNGSLDRSIDLEMLCVTISPRLCMKLNVVKFIGFSKIYFFDAEYAHHSDENKYFFNQCSFEFKNKVTIKLFSNGTYIITGCTNETDAKKHLTAMLTIISTKKYVYMPKCMIESQDSDDKLTSRLALVYNVPVCNWRTFKTALTNYSISLRVYEFNKYKVKNIANIVTPEEYSQIELITDIFKYSAVSIKLRDINGNIDIYKNRVIISVQTSEHYSTLLNFFNKYKYKLISLPTTNTISKLVFLNSALMLARHGNNDDASDKIELPRKVVALTNNIINKINK